MSDEKKHIIMDSQMLNGIQLCPMRYNFQFEMNLKTPNVPEPIEEGDMVHVMAEAFYNRKKDLPNFQDQFDAVLDECEAIGIEHSKTLQLPPAEVEETIYQFREEAKHHRLDGYTPLIVEHPFLITLFEDEDLAIHYAGKIDLIAQTPEYGKAVIDHKTMRRKSVPLDLSNQFTGYAVAAEVDYVIVNKIGFQKTLKPHERFLRYPLFYTQEMKERWKQNTIYWGQYLATCLENDSWPENRTSCDKYSGCIYIPICSANTHDARLWKIKSQYIVDKEWDPTSILKTAS